MDDRDEDEKRRVMTPPKEWNGDQDDSDSDSDWLSDAESEPDQQGKEETPERPEVDDAGWLTAEDAPPEPDFAPAADSEPEADWFSEDDLAAAPDPSPAPPKAPADSSARPEKAPPAAKTGENINFSSEDLLTDHQIVGTGSAGRLPLWPTLGGAVAVVLLMIGGWGAISERTALQQRIVELEQQQSTPKSMGDLDAGAEAELAAENQALQMQLSSLRDQYNVANSMISDLQAELDASAGGVEAEAPVPVAEVEIAPEEPETTVSEDPPPAPVAAPQPESAVADTDSTPPEPTEVVTGAWFVNVAAYSKSTTAESWRDKLLGEGFNAITQTVDTGGRTLHRVRAVGFSTQTEAKAAAAELEDAYKIGPLWVGEDSSLAPAKPVDALDPAVETPAPETSPTAAGVPPTPSPTTGTGPGGWFIYVDTYAQGLEADKKAQQIEDAGYAAKVAVEYRSNELFYRVQIVGIESRGQGEDIIETLAARGDMPNLQLRQY